MTDRTSLPTPERIAVDAYFDKGRCSGHAQFNGRYCRDAAGPERWCIHCAGLMLLARAEALESELSRLRAEKTNLDSAIGVIHKAVRGDHKSECWTIRKWLDERGVFNDDIQGSDRLVEAACVFALSTPNYKPAPPAEDRA